jgi:putative ABC transport system substrate-binding protein
MRRRDFLGTLAGTIVSWPLSARAQQPAKPLVGFVRSTSAAESFHIVSAFRRGLEEAGFIDGQNVTIEFRWADNNLNRLPGLVDELTRLPVAVLVANTPSALAATATKTNVPIVFASGGDPIREGLVTSLNRPGGNITGVNYMFSELASKRLSLLRQLVPNATKIGVLSNLNIPNTVAEKKELLAAAKIISQPLVTIDVTRQQEFEPAFVKFKQGVGAVFVGSGGFFNSKHVELVDLASRYQIPASYVWREAAVAGGLMSYGPSITDSHRQAGVYAGRILKGEKPGDLPVMRSNTFEFVLNLKTAKTLGLEIHPQLVATANEVIE